MTITDLLSCLLTDLLSCLPGRILVALLLTISILCWILSLKWIRQGLFTFLFGEKEDNEQ